MSRVHRLTVGVVVVVLLGALAACTNSDGQPEAAPSTTFTGPPPTAVPTAPSESAAAQAPGAAALGDDPTSSAAGKPIDRVDWVTPSPERAAKTLASPKACHQDKVSAELVSCILGDPDGDVNVAVVGDSKTRQWVPALDIAAKKLGWRLTVSTKSSCAFTTAETATGGIRGPYPSCDEWNKALIAKIKRDKPDVVVNALYKMRAKVSGDDTAMDARQAMIEGVRDAIGQVAATGAQVVLFDSSPMNKVDVADCVAKNPATLTDCATPRKQAFNTHDTWSPTSVERVTSVSSNTHLIDLNDYICPASSCAPIIGNVLIFHDRHHVTVQYMQTLAPMVLDSLRKLDLN